MNRLINLSRINLLFAILALFVISCKKDRAGNTEKDFLSHSTHYTDEEQHFLDLEAFLDSAVHDRTFSNTEEQRALRYMEGAINYIMCAEDQEPTDFRVDSFDISYSTFNVTIDNVVTSMISGSDVSVMLDSVYSKAYTRVAQATFDTALDKFISLIDFKWNDNSGNFSYISSNVLRVVVYSAIAGPNEPGCMTPGFAFISQDVTPSTCDQYTPVYEQMQANLNGPCNPQSCIHTFGADSDPIAPQVVHLDVVIDEREDLLSPNVFYYCMSQVTAENLLAHIITEENDSRPEAFVNSSYSKSILRSHVVKPIPFGTDSYWKVFIPYANCFWSHVERVSDPIFVPSQ